MATFSRKAVRKVRIPAVQRQAYEEQTDSGTEHFGDEEEPGTRAVGRHAETVLQIFVDGYQVHFVEQRYQQIGYDKLSAIEANTICR